MAGLPRLNLALFNGWDGWDGWEWWEGGSGDGQTTDVLEDDTSDTYMCIDDEKKASPDLPKDYEVNDDTANPYVLHMEKSSEKSESKQEVCKSAKRPDPLIASWQEKGLYCSKGELGEGKTPVAVGATCRVFAGAGAGENGKVDVSSKSEVLEIDFDPYLEIYEKSSVSQKSKDNKSVRTKAGNSNIFMEEFDNELNLTKSEKKMKTDKREALMFIEKAGKKPSEKAQDNKPVAKIKESISSVFNVEDDPYVLEIWARKKEAEMLAVDTKIKIKGNEREAKTRMDWLSQSLTSSQCLDECLPESSLDQMTKTEIPILKNSRMEIKSSLSEKKVNYIFEKNVDTSMEKEITDESEEAIDYNPSIDELLKVPDCPKAGGMTKDEELDALDLKISERRKQHEEEMSQLDMEIAAERQRQQERRERMVENAVLRDKLQVEINKLVLQRMFAENKEYLKDIESGRVESWRHQAFHESGRARQALFFKMITDPFSEDQLDWTLEEMGKVWMKSKKEQMDNNEYVWKVLLPECFIKFYMDFFKLDKKEAEKRISETPLSKVGEENSSDDDL